MAANLAGESCLSAKSEQDRSSEDNPPYHPTQLQDRLRSPATAYKAASLDINVTHVQGGQRRESVPYPIFVGVDFDTRSTEPDTRASLET
jgi:hypothetical protein